MITKKSVHKIINKTILITMYSFAFLLPLLLLITLFEVNGFYPLAESNKTFAMIDMQGQYIAFFRYYQRILFGEYNLIYTLAKVSGGDMLSIFAYYLASPFNLFLYFFSPLDLPSVLLTFVMIKISLAGLTSYISLQHMHPNPVLNIVFSTSYALMSYNFVYYSNIMWLDGIYTLPLVILGIDFILKGKENILYAITLGYALFTSWYIGIMIALASVFFFLTQFVGRLESIQHKGKVLLKYTVGSLLAGGVASPIWMTALANLSGTRGMTSFNLLNLQLGGFFDYVSIQRGFFIGGFQGMSDITGIAAHVYLGLFPLLAGFLLFFNKHFSLRFKLSNFILIGLYLLALFNKGLDQLFHGGAVPNWFPARYAFVLGFFLINLAAMSMNQFKNTRWYGFIILVLFYTGIRYSLFNNGYVLEPIDLTYFSAFLTLLLLLYFSIHVFENRGLKIKIPLFAKKIALGFLIFIIGMVSINNLYWNNNFILKTLSETLNHQTLSSYKDDEKIADAINWVKSIDGSLYRMEKSFIRSGTYNNANNDAMYYGYHGLSHFSSNEKKATMELMRKIGFHYNGFNANYQNGSTLSMNAYLGVKYLLDKGTNPNFQFTKQLTSVHQDNESTINIYLNPYALPLLFATEKLNDSYVGEGHYLTDNEIYWYDIFEYQNQIFKSLTQQVVDEFGNPKDIFKKANYNQSLFQVTPLENDYHYQVTQEGNIVYNVNLQRGKNYYYYIHTSSTDNLGLIENNSNKTYFSYHGYQINGLNSTNTNASITVTIQEPKDDIRIQEAIYYEDLDVLAEYIQAIKMTAPVVVNQHQSSRYEAVITTTQPQQSMLMTIPYDSNLRIVLNGKAIPAQKKFNIFTGFVIPKEGTHTVVISYVQTTLGVSIPIALISGVWIFLGSKITDTLKKRRI
jgi:uncharacterized membrane protein YfhO